MDQSTHTIAVELSWWEGWEVGRLEEGVADIYYATSVTKEWWFDGGGGYDYRPRKDLRTKTFRVPLSDEEWSLLNSDDPGVEFVGNLALVPTRKFDFKANQIRHKIGVRWFQERPRIRGLLVKVIGFRLIKLERERFNDGTFDTNGLQRPTVVHTWIDPARPAPVSRSDSESEEETP